MNDFYGKCILAVFVSLFFSGCVTDYYEHIVPVSAYNKHHYNKVPRVEVYKNGELPEKSYWAIGELEVQSWCEGFFNWFFPPDSKKHAYRMLLKKAKKERAEGLIYIETECKLFYKHFLYRKDVCKRAKVTAQAIRSKGKSIVR